VPYLKNLTATVRTMCARVGHIEAGRSNQTLFCQETFTQLAGGCSIFDDFSHRLGVRDHHDM